MQTFEPINSIFLYVFEARYLVWSCLRQGRMADNQSWLMAEYPEN